MKEAPGDTYPPSTIAGRPRSRPSRGSGIAAVIVSAVAIGAVVGYSAAEPTPSHPTPTTAQPQAPSRPLDSGEQSTTNNRGESEQLTDRSTAPIAEADLRIAVEARLGIDLDDFTPAEQTFLIALATEGTDVFGVSHVTHP